MEDTTAVPASDRYESGARAMRVPTRLGSLGVQVIGDGPDTVLWSSMFVDTASWDRLVPLLPGRRLVLVDGPGLGRSDPLQHRSTIAEAADAAVDLLTGLRAAGVLSEEAPAWVGNAFGGHVGFELGVRPGVLGSLVAISAPPEPIPAALRRQIRMLRPLLRLLGPIGPVRAAILSGMITDDAARDPELRALVEASLARPTRRSLTLALDSFILARVDVTDHLARIQVPALYLAGDDRGDWSPEDAQRAAVLTPRASAVTIERSRTLLPLEQPHAVAAALHTFWASLA
ncbi:alpha/beta fold hydrolase [Millisia brevis]|uniref:alpha/beta fold hydrolase n=1 Tax=Millisia brevis TaxID=264148 RepID=UPI001470C175|nr:alpha/beta hydrolase [Millisia brevis]